MGKGWLLLLLLWGSPAALAQVSFQDGVVLERQQRSIPLAGAADRIAIWNQRLLVGQMEAQSLASWSLEGGEVQWQLPLGLVPTVLLVD
ncbi:MAG: hypothetical protein Q6L58_05690, partial [Thermostichales cyanobacterium BF3_bins_165]